MTVIFFRVFHPHFCQFSASRFLLTHKTEFLHHKFPVFPVFQNIRIFKVLIKVSYEIQGFQGPLNSFQGFQDPIDPLHLQNKLASYFHSKSSTF